MRAAVASCRCAWHAGVGCVGVSGQCFRANAGGHRQPGGHLHRARRRGLKNLARRGRRESEQLRSVLLDSVTHEFRSPLTAIKASVPRFSAAESFSGASFAEEKQELLTSR